MKQIRADERSGLFSSCGVSGTCADGHRISCVKPWYETGSCTHMYVSFEGESGSGHLNGVMCGSEAVYCNDTPSGSMPVKVKSCLNGTQWSGCKFLDENANEKYGWCRYGDPASPSPWKNYLYCSDLPPTHPINGTDKNIETED